MQALFCGGGADVRQRTDARPCRGVSWLYRREHSVRPRPGAHPCEENIIDTISTHVGALRLMRLAALPLFGLALGAALAPPVHAQQQQQQAHRAGAPRIEGFNVDEVGRLAPGVELNFSLYGTPGGSATIRIDGARRNLRLDEVDAGLYEGTYTIGNGDRIAARSPVTANLRMGREVSSAVLSESLLRGVGYHAAQPNRGPAPAALRIERFEVQPGEDLNPGSELQFSLRGTPGAKADMSIAGSKGVYFLTEESAGAYAGSYTIKRRDRISADSAVVVNLRKDGRVVSATLRGPLLLARAAQPAPRPPRVCANCATVEAVNVIEVNGDGSYLGTIGGGVVGALLGSQVGGGKGRTAAEIAGALGGAYAGRNIERTARASSHVEVVVRYANGGAQTVAYQNDPGYRVGEKIRVVNGTLARDE
ncbi:glycine zipper 2TM domain-containing protein [Janthinobacterium sp.]|uniref:glycine zipper 2TM domain-containing protein n=1 Tax=Janthinobacterium sp. TaxID=1871054 RepID=UPI00293D3020|nr:glycine zipper 2TM domain-containing protein [Janthinobacterium sp.]